MEPQAGPKECQRQSARTMVGQWVREHAWAVVAVIMVTILAVGHSLQHERNGLYGTLHGGKTLTTTLRDEQLLVRPDGTVRDCTCEGPAAATPTLAEARTPAAWGHLTSSAPADDDLDAEIPLPEGVEPFRPGMMVFVAGLPRTGSTSLYNIVRVLVRTVDPNVVAGFMNWYKDTTISKWKSLNVSVVLKSHIMRGDMSPMVEHFVFSHRDTVDEVCSIKLFKLRGMDIFEQFNQTQEDTYIQTRTIMCHQRSCYLSAQRLGARVAYDMDMAQLIRDPLSVVRDLALSLGIPGLTRRRLQYLLEEVQGLRPVTVGMIHPVTLLHHGHNMKVHEKDLSACKNLVKEHLMEDADFTTWVNNGGKYIGDDEMLFRVCGKSRGRSAIP